MRRGCWWCVKLNYCSSNVLWANELAEGKLDPNPTLTSDHTGTLVSASPRMVDLPLGWGDVAICGKVFESLQEALCSAPKGISSQAHSEGLEFYWEQGTFHGSKKLLQLFIMEPSLEKPLYFYLAWCFRCPRVTLTREFLPFLSGVFWRTKSPSFRHRAPEKASWLCQALGASVALSEFYSLSVGTWLE